MKSLKISIFILLITLARAEQVKIDTKTQSSAKKDNDTTLDSAIVIVGIVLVILELLLWYKQRREKSLIAFSVFTKDGLQECPSHTQSQNDFDAGKVQANAEQVMSKDQSPGIKTIKAMTQDTQQRQSRRKRKRKADKLSDRRSKQQSQVVNEYQ